MSRGGMKASSGQEEEEAKKKMTRSGDHKVGKKRRIVRGEGGKRG